MAQNVTVRGPSSGLLIAKATIHLDFDRFDKFARAEFLKRLMLICEAVKTQVQRNISVSSRASGPSAVGEFPHADTGRLRNSIFWRVDQREMRGIVGTPLFYGVYLEYGTEGGKVIRPTNAKVLSWVDRQTGERRFARQVVTKPQGARSFLRRTLVSMKNPITRILQRPFPVMPRGVARVGG